MSGSTTWATCAAAWRRWAAAAGIGAALLAAGPGGGARGQIRQEPADARQAVWQEEHSPEGIRYLKDITPLCNVGDEHAKDWSSKLRDLAIAEKQWGADHVWVARRLHDLAWVCVRYGDPEGAVKLSARAAEGLDRHLILALSTYEEDQKLRRMSDLQWATYGNVALHLQLAPRVPEAARLALTSILRRKGRLLDTTTDSFAAQLRGVDGEDRALVDELRKVSTKLSELAWSNASDLDRETFTRTLDRLEARRARIESEVLRRRAPDLRPVTLDEIQAAIPEGAALVELFRYEAHTARDGSDEWRYAAYVLRRGGALAWADLGEARPIERAVERLRRELARGGSDPRPAARALDALVMQPIRPLLGEARSILLSPDGALNLVPFGALIDEAGHHLVEGLTFTYLATGRDLLRLQSSAPPRQGAVILAAPAFGSGAAPSAERGASHGRSMDTDELAFRPLASAAEEGRAVGHRLGGAGVLAGAEATEGALKALRGPWLLHLATHGFFLPAPVTRYAPPKPGTTYRGNIGRIEDPLLLSGLALAGANERHGGDEDGILTALEASYLDLHGTRLVVLSACETGVGEVRSGDGVYGLRRALTAAGAEALVMSLWKVDDAATRELMDAYYDALLRGGGRSEAMRQVQLSMLARPERAHAHYWASFIVSGNGAALDGRPAAPEVARVQPGPRGCGCEVAGARGHAGAWAAALGALALTRRRRARRGRAAQTSMHGAERIDVARRGRRTP